MSNNISTSYKISRPISELPPTEPLVIPITGSVDIDLVQTKQAMIVDMVIRNKDSVAAVITVNDQPGYSLDAGDTISEDNIAIYHVAISGITNGLIYAHTLDINLLKRYGALEVA